MGIEEDGLTISAVERELGIGKDTLRVWERRYGFPNPKRDANGERRYPPDQVARLRLVRRLLDQGMRPHQLLSLPADALEDGGQPGTAEEEGGERHAELLHLVRQHDAQALQHTLRTLLLRDGLERFVLDTAAPLIEAIGRWWERGKIEVFEEHLATEQLHRVLREAVSQAVRGGGRPRVVITTLPNEPHTLGLLLAESVMRLDGADCTPLGGQTPASQILAAARASSADIVALSFSRFFGQGPMREGIAGLRAALPPNVELWCGGAGAARLKKPPAGVQVLAGLADIRPQLARWRGPAQGEHGDLAGAGRGIRPSRGERVGGGGVNRTRR
jgi:DNA-binding transcriptional MerR regulator/methylmalonyl-CoA mutase cobalamin-binding subunit